MAEFWLIEVIAIFENNYHKKLRVYRIMLIDVLGTCPELNFKVTQWMQCL